MQGLALRGGFEWPPPRLRPVIAVVIFGATLAGAAILHGVHATSPTCPRGFICAWGTGAEPFSRYPAYPRQGWGDQFALTVIFLGFAGAAAVLLTRRRAAAVLVLGAGLAGATILYFQNQLVTTDCPDNLRNCSGPLQAAWFGGLAQVDTPTWVFHSAALALGLLGFAGAGLVPLTARRPVANAALVFGAALISAATLQVIGYPGGYLTCDFHDHPFGRGSCLGVQGRRWVDPASLALCVLGLTGAAGLLVTARRNKPQ